jgi:L-ribulokinase
MPRPDRYLIGVDFGTESCRALLIDLDRRQEVATASAAYDHGVIDQALFGAPLERGWALQAPNDYPAALRRAVSDALADARVDRRRIVGVGIAFTSCTVLPVLRDGTPLCCLPRFHRNPHAWAKLWKHHGAQRQADRVKELLLARAPRLSVLGAGRYSAESLTAKLLQIAEEAPELYRAADRIIEAGDWIVWLLTGVETRNESMAAFKGLWTRADGWPAPVWFGALHHDLADVVVSKLSATLVAPDSIAGRLTASAAAALGLTEGIPVAPALIDAHAAAIGSGACRPNALAMILGTSGCYITHSADQRTVPGVFAVADGVVLPGLWTYEAGQPAVGDIFGWFFRTFNLDRDECTAAAARLTAGESGLLAIDWWNGDRSAMMTADLSGLILGLTLQTRPHEIYRALIEATALGADLILQAFRDSGFAFEEAVACGGLAHANSLVMQVFADVTNTKLRICESQHAAALGAALQAAVAVGAYDDVQAAADTFAGASRTVYSPSREAHNIYRGLLENSRKLRRFFSSVDPEIMAALKVRGDRASTGVSEGGAS